MQLYAFDLLALGGEDLRQLPLTMRKTNLSRLLRRRPDGMFVAPFESGEIGPELFHAAVRRGLEGLVSKRRDRRYGAGRSQDWIKVKNRTHPAMSSSRKPSPLVIRWIEITRGALLRNSAFLSVVDRLIRRAGHRKPIFVRALGCQLAIGLSLREQLILEG
ncbi:hypothetical protein ML401_38875 [Bradyrhizobium sp. 62B]|uniref:ATP-dependent DNA ligase n=1 Tax=Bradyrhizobium sp. 62B TaxID=2898442 RepID=UPI003255BB34|nr:hypothetical protein ML401_38875 [Bradyrhizobium sp. 62B]